MLTSLRLLTLGLLIGGAFGLTDCKKTREPDPTPSARELLLTTPKWRLDGFAEEVTAATGAVKTTRIPLTSFDPCSLDDFEYYHADKSFVIDEGQVKCSAKYPGAIVKGIWAFAANETELTVTSDNSQSYSRSIRALNADTMTLASPPTTQSNGGTLVQLRIYSAH